MVTRNAYMSMLDDIWEKIGMDEKMETVVEKLKNDFDEKEKIIGKYGTIINDDGVEDYEFIENNYESVKNKAENDVEDYKSKYEELKEKYKKRFFGKVDEIKEEQEEDIKRDGTKQTFEELFEERED